jgi:hypothetical protein
MSRDFRRGATLTAVYLQGVRHGLGSNGQPENPELNQRAVRRSSNVVDESPDILFPFQHKHQMDIDDLDPVQLDFMAECGVAIDRNSIKDSRMDMETSTNEPANCE